MNVMDGKKEMKERKGAEEAPKLPSVDVTQIHEWLRLTYAERLRLATESSNNLRAFLDRARIWK